VINHNKILGIIFILRLAWESTNPPELTLFHKLETDTVMGGKTKPIVIRKAVMEVLL
jgi:hypothetical protein